MAHTNSWASQAQPPTPSRAAAARSTAIRRSRAAISAKSKLVLGARRSCCSCRRGVRDATAAAAISFSDAKHCSAAGRASGAAAARSAKAACAARARQLLLHRASALPEPAIQRVLVHWRRVHRVKFTHCPRLRMRSGGQAHELRCGCLATNTVPTTGQTDTNTVRRWATQINTRAHSPDDGTTQGSHTNTRRTTAR